MRTCNIMICVGKDQHVRCDCLTTEQIFDWCKNEVWFAFESFYDSESQSRMWYVGLSGIWVTYGKGKGYTFGQALSRAFNKFMTNHKKFDDQQELLRGCCVSFDLCLQIEDGVVENKDGTYTKHGQPLTICPFCNDPIKIIKRNKS